MKFWEAMKALDEGKKVHCPSWKGYVKWQMALNSLNIPHIIAQSGRDGIDFCVYLYQCLGADWEIYEEPVKNYSFPEAIELMKEGKKMTRPSWMENSYVHLNMHGYFDKYGYPINWSIKDIEATDWIIF